MVVFPERAKINVAQFVDYLVKIEKAFIIVSMDHIYDIHVSELKLY